VILLELFLLASLDEHLDEAVMKLTDMSESVGYKASQATKSELSCFQRDGGGVADMATKSLGS